jgi:cardiolipin synthase
MVLLGTAIQFFFNPMGLGPEPITVLSDDFFAGPTQDPIGLKLLVDGREAFTEILEAIDSATSSIYVQTYIWKDDSTGRQVVAALKAATGRGVRMTVSKDMVGTVFELGSILRGKPSPVFTKTGLKEHDNISVRLDLFADTDHSKYFIVDDRLIIFGGMNIADEYRYQWHDYMALIESRRWTKAFKNKVLKGVPWPSQSPFVVAVNDHNTTEIRTALIEMIDRAVESLIIEHAYFSDDRVIDAVKRAAARHVKVVIILPEKADTHQYANMVTINRLLGAGPENAISIYLFPEMSHAKVALADKKIAVIGSANLTPRSMLTSREVALFMHGSNDEPFIKKLRAQLLADIAKSDRVLHPFRISSVKSVMALVEKYVW